MHMHIVVSARRTIVNEHETEPELHYNTNLHQIMSDIDTRLPIVNAIAY